MTHGEDIKAYHRALSDIDREICELLADEIDRALPEARAKVWHSHPVWFLENNPIVGYDRLKDAVRLMFWSGQSFDETGLTASGTFKAAEVRYTDPDQIDRAELAGWLAKSRDIQWDYANIRATKGNLERRTAF